MELGVHFSPYVARIFIFFSPSPYNTRPVCLSRCRDLIRWMPSCGMPEREEAHTHPPKGKKETLENDFLKMENQHIMTRGIVCVWGFSFDRFRQKFSLFIYLFFSFLRQFPPIVLLPGFRSITKLRVTFSLLFVNHFPNSFLGSSLFCFVLLATFL